MLTAAERDSAEWQRVISLEESFLLDPNSPYRNEELYLPVLERQLSSPMASEKQQQRAAWLKPYLLLNRPGQPANDFEYVTPKGRRTTLYATLDARKPKRTILFFSNPGCPNCKEITETLSQSQPVQARIETGDLLVVNIYPDVCPTTLPTGSAATIPTRCSRATPSTGSAPYPLFICWTKRNGSSSRTPHSSNC